ncbi:MAG: cytochrome C oxidase subunit IV family protein [Dehalococcoidia bacterium]|nr:cytochrome C oxidase subunit IV family protein [Dehalococcoidia bacterium]
MTLSELRKKRGAPERPAEPAADTGHREKHPGPLEYAQIGVVLAIVTAIEVGIYYLDMAHGLLVALLIGLSLLKFSLVVLWFMHLKFDNRVYSSMFLFGVFLAVLIFLVALSTVGGKLV